MGRAKELQQLLPMELSSRKVMAYISHLGTPTCLSKNSIRAIFNYHKVHIPIFPVLYPNVK